MDIHAAKKLQKQMPYKDIYFDSVHDCYRLIDRSEWYAYRDEEGHLYNRIDPEKLIPIYACLN